ncbi:hypothetical protein RF11_15575 [Thelohanellus kitauei]|uniref:GAR domain-containing protein n=1 Tax=Thelohanellus kitauei TaxID=669202 RepID=A0A0C2I7V9_THEKT|nr:hypothetical protein RF11_15575 [Thelohanellus kitauei]
MMRYASVKHVYSNICLKCIVNINLCQSATDSKLNAGEQEIYESRYSFVNQTSSSCQPPLSDGILRSLIQKVEYENIDENGLDTSSCDMRSPLTSISAESSPKPIVCDLVRDKKLNVTMTKRRERKLPPIPTKVIRDLSNCIKGQVIIFNRKYIAIIVSEDTILIRIGGGFEYIEEFLDYKFRIFKRAGRDLSTITIDIKFPNVKRDLAQKYDAVFKKKFSEAIERINLVP